MRFLLVVFSVVSSVALATLPAPRLLLIPGWVPALVRDVAPDELLYNDTHLTVVTVNPEKMENWVLKVHQELKACGGFIDITDEVARGRGLFEIIEQTARGLEQPSEVRFTPVVFKPEIAQLVAGASADKYWAFLTELTQFENRSARSAKGIEAASFIEQKAFDYSSHLIGSKTWTIPTSSSYLMDQPSVVVTLEGTDPSLPHVVIGGHLDTISSGSKQPGSDDDGSGTSVVMEALRVVANQNVRFKHPVDFVWYAAEEYGLVGSRHVVDYFASKNIAVKNAIQFDMVGYKSVKDDKDIYLINDYTNAGLTTLVKDLIRSYTKATIGDTRCGYACSDHVNWHLAGIPAVFPFEASFANMNGRIHTPNDEMKYLDKDHAFAFVQVALAYLGETAELVVENGSQSSL